MVATESQITSTAGSMTHSMSCLTLTTAVNGGAVEAGDGGSALHPHNSAVTSEIDCRMARMAFPRRRFGQIPVRPVPIVAGLHGAMVFRMATRPPGGLRVFP